MPSKEESQGWVLIFGAAQPPLSLVTTLTGDTHVSLPVLEVMRDEALPSRAGSASLLQTSEKRWSEILTIQKDSPNQSYLWKSGPG